MSEKIGCLLGGKPLIEWTLDYLIDSPLIKRVIISTDDDFIIANYTNNYSNKVTTLVRPDHLSGDKVTSDLVLSYICQKLGNEYLNQFDYGVYMQITEPYRPHDILERCSKLYLESEHDCVFAAAEYHKNFWTLQGSQLRRLQDGNKPDAPRQEKNTLIREDTGICLVASLELLRSGRRIGNNPGFVFYNHIGMFVDIHTQQDLDFAEKLLY